MNANSIGQGALNERDNRAANNGQTQNAGTLTGVLAKTMQREAEDRREHDRVEQADSKYRPHGNMACGSDCDEQENNCDGCIKGKRLAVINIAHCNGADETSDHCTAPEIGNVMCGIGFSQSCD